MKKKTYLLYGKNTIYIILIELLLSLGLIVAGIILTSTNVIYLIVMLLCASFFVFDLIKKINYKLVLSNDKIIVSNDELPVSKKIQFYTTALYSEIEDLYLEESNLNSKGEKIMQSNKPNYFLVLKCHKTLKRICINYFKSDELYSLVEDILIRTNINKDIEEILN